ncbi:Wzz/FepE/Etk N-terminal domain-containing protein [uncultured Fusobacterium sp.]|uniref:YveK family protein n=1 Tax=uncultured Fusobacterium sp. TaxID=159267 RepID=UPI0028060988|nr:Wzz/FepE/Etk N-terminal domain-containing protein [uncultured Fusobacterium sp.]
MRQKSYEEERYYEEDNDEIDLVDLIFMLIRRWKVIVLMMIPTIILGFIFAITRPSVYEANTTLIVSSGMAGIGLNNSDISLNQKLVVTYSEIAKSRDILTRVISKYDLPETPEILGKKISIGIVKDTELIKLAYSCNDPKLAEAVTNELANEFIKKVGQVMKVRNVNVVEKAIEPLQPLPKKRGRTLLASIIFGGMLGIGVAALIEFLHKKLRKSADIEKILGVQILGMIPEIDFDEKVGEQDE